MVGRLLSFWETLWAMLVLGRVTGNLRRMCFWCQDSLGLAGFKWFFCLFVCLFVCLFFCFFFQSDVIGIQETLTTPLRTHNLQFLEWWNRLTTNQPIIQIYEFFSPETTCSRPSMRKSNFDLHPAGRSRRHLARAMWTCMTSLKICCPFTWETLAMSQDFTYAYSYPPV